MKISIWMLAGSMAFFQSARPTFEVASVKQNKSGGNAINNHFDAGRMNWINTPLRVLIQNAYRVMDYQVVDLPGWASTDRWDIDARTNGPTTMTVKSEMMKALFEERFHFAFHNETRQLPEFNLEVAKGGPRLRKADPAKAGRGGVRIDKGLIEGHNTTMETLVGFLKGELGQPVFDKTGLAGEYDFRLEWLPDESQPSGGHEVPGADAAGAPIFTAIQGLGLRLAPFKGPVEIMVVDHVEKAAEN